MTAICGGCNDAIQDQYMFHVLDKSWHTTCLKCHDCLLPQTESCFYRDGLILCRTDFTRRFGTRCSGCNLILEKEDLVRRARDLVFHVRCFQCAICQKTLDTGEQLYVLGGNRFICKDDYLSSSVGSEECGSTDDLDDECHEDDEIISNDAQSSPPYARTSSNQSNHLLELDGGSGNEDGKFDENSLSTKRRGPRTTIKSKQLETLKSAFNATPKPTRHMREQLAAETGLNMRVIQVWFQNRRSKERRMKQTRLSCGFRPSRRNRGGNTLLRNDEINGVFCDILDPMQQQPGTTISFGYNNNNNPGGMAHPIPTFFSAQQQQNELYSSQQGNGNNSIAIDSLPVMPMTTINENSTITSLSGNNRFTNNDATSNIQQLEALAAAVHVSSSDYSIDEALLHSSTVLGGGGNGASLSLTAW